MTHILYIIARNDLASMNPGKLAAQASHASNAFVDHFHAAAAAAAGNSLNSGGVFDAILNTAFYEWSSSTKQGFGTVLVLEAKMKDLYPAIDVLKACNYIAGIIHDPTYPILDGEVVHYIPLDTCAYVFVPDKETDRVASSILKQFSLHR